MDRIESVDLSGNFLASLPLALAALNTLRRLDMSNNQLTSISSDILANLTSLTELSLSGNLLHQADDLDLFPLAPSLTVLDLARNMLPRLPSTFQKSFPVLRSVDLSSNKIATVPSSLLTNLPQLESLVLDNNMLTTVVLEPLSRRLRFLSLLGNRLRCDCKSLWLRRVLESKRVSVFLPPCFSPFSRNTLTLQSFEGTSLCSLTDETRIPKFFRVTDQDSEHFPRATFTSLSLISAKPSLTTKTKATNVIVVDFSIQLEFYYNEFDWGLIYRQIGAEGGKGNNMFYKTRANLRDHAAAHPDWSPRQEESSFELSVPSASGFYEVCLAVVEQSTTYYLHQHLCIEVSPQHSPSPPALSNSTSTLSTNLTVVPDITSVAVGWQLAEGEDPVVRQISVRRFGEAEEERVLVRDLHNASSDSARFYSVDGLSPGAGYTVCFSTIYGDIEQGMEKAMDAADCREVTTLASNFPVKEVATAAAVSTSTTAMVVAILCCCCFPCRKKRGRTRNLDVNENEKVKEEEEGKGDRLFHQRYEGDGCGRLWMGCVHPTSSECSPPSNSRDSSTSPGEESVYSQIRPPALPHTCHHGNTDLKERRVEEDFDNRQTGHHCPAANLTVRSAQSLSSKYSDRRPDVNPGKRHVRKNASLCVRQELGHTCHQAAPPCVLPDAAQIKSGHAPPSPLPRPRLVVRKRVSAPIGRYHTVSSHSHHQFYKRGLPLQYYTPPQQADYLTSFVPPPELRRTTSSSQDQRNRSGKYYPATFSHAPLELRPIKMKKSMKKTLGGGTMVAREPGKMYTWSPYTSNLFYSEPSGADQGIKTTEELRF